MSSIQLRPEVFLYAAESIHTHAEDFACFAVRNALGRGVDCTAEVNALRALYQEDAISLGHDPFVFFWKRGSGPEAEPKQAAHRVFALLLLHEIARDENRRARWRRNSKAYRSRKPKWRKLEVGEITAAGDEVNALGNMDRAHNPDNWHRNQLQAPSSQAGWILLRGGFPVEASALQFLCYRRREKGAA